MVLKTQYRRYCLRRTRQRLLKKAGEYFVPGINVLLALKQTADLYAELLRINEELGKAGKG